MSRLAIAFVLVTSLTSGVFASDSIGFARPPSDQIEATMPARYLDRDAVRAKLLERRAQNLAHFRAYQAKGTFPANLYLEGDLNVWIDDFGNVCAAASIIKASGGGELVKRVGDQTNFIRLVDVTQGPLMDWMLMSGFTKEEIVEIQAPMPYLGGDERRLNEQLQVAENARLAKLYKTVERSLLKNQKKSIELAVTRLMQNPALAWQLLDS